MTLLNTLKHFTDKRITNIFILGYVSGLPLPLVLSTLYLWLAEFGISKTSIGFFAAATIPYTFKFIWAPFIDGIKIKLFKLPSRLNWLLLIEILLSFSICSMAFIDPSKDLVFTFSLVLIISFLSATQDIIIDAYRVESLPDNMQTEGAAFLVFGYRVAMLASGAGALYLAEFYSWQYAYLILGAQIPIGFISAVILSNYKNLYQNETKINNQNKLELVNIKERLYKMLVMPLYDFIKNHKLWVLILLFIVTFKFSDAFVAIMTNLFFKDLGFSKADIATYNKIYGFISLILGGIAGAYIVNKLGNYKALLTALILQVASNLMFVALYFAGKDYLYFMLTVIIENFTGGIGTTIFVGYLSLLCNKEYTATQYALLSSLASLGRTIFGSFSGIIVDQYDWIIFFIISILISLPVFLILKYLEKQKHFVNLIKKEK